MKSLPLESFIGSNPRLLSMAALWNEEAFCINGSKPDLKNAELVHTTPYRKLPWGYPQEWMTTRYEFFATRDEVDHRHLLLCRTVKSTGEVLIQSGAVGEYDGENLGIMAAYRGLGAGRAFVKHLISNGELKPSIGYSEGGLATVKSAWREWCDDLATANYTSYFEALRQYPSAEDFKNTQPLFFFGSPWEAEYLTAIGAGQAPGVEYHFTTNQQRYEQRVAAIQNAIESCAKPTNGQSSWTITDFIENPERIHGLSTLAGLLREPESSCYLRCHRPLVTDCHGLPLPSESKQAVQRARENSYDALIFTNAAGGEQAAILWDRENFITQADLTENYAQYRQEAQNKILAGIPFKKIITHSGLYHADEVAAIGLLRSMGVTAPVERKRHVLPEEFENPHVLVLDVGRRHEPNKGNFDHHQDPLLPATNILVADAFVKDAEVNRLLKRHLFNYISDVDRGILVPSPGVPTANTMVRAMNDKNPDDTFEQALGWMSRQVEVTLKKSRQSITDRQRWEELERMPGIVIDTKPGQRLEGWKDLAKEEGIYAFIYPQADSSGIIQSYGVVSRDNAPNRFKIPADKRQIFCHNAGFLAIYKTLPDAISHTTEILEQRGLLKDVSELRARRQELQEDFIKQINAGYRVPIGESVYNNMYEERALSGPGGFIHRIPPYPNRPAMRMVFLNEGDQHTVGIEEEQAASAMVSTSQHLPLIFTGRKEIHPDKIYVEGICRDGSDYRKYLSQQECDQLDTRVERYQRANANLVPTLQDRLLRQVSENLAKVMKDESYIVTEIAARFLEDREDAMSVAFATTHPGRDIRAVKMEAIQLAFQEAGGAERFGVSWSQWAANMEGEGVTKERIKQLSCNVKA
jgi:hypothetical protein